MTSLVEPVRTGSTFVVLAGRRDEIATARWKWSTGLGVAVRVVRGRKMRDVTGVFDEFAAALQFPTYFGENKDAFDECIREADEFSRDVGLVVLLIEPDQVLADEPLASLGWLVSSLEDAAVEWGTPIALGEWWDRPAVPFHVVLAGDGPTIAASIARWEAAGVSDLGTVDADGTIGQFSAVIPLADVLRPHGVDLAALPAAEVDPFAQEGALQEAQLLSVRFDAVTGVAGLLFEMRPSLQVRDANTGVLVARRVRELSWSSPARSGGLSAWPVGSSTTHRRAGMVRFELDMWPAPGASLSFDASDADFFLGRVPGLTAAPPDYTEVSPKEADGRIADWNSSFVPVGLSRCLPSTPDARVG